MDIAKFSEIASALANENRVKIMSFIAEHGEQCAQGLLEHFHFSQPTMSQHIRVLRQSQLLIMRKEGRWQFFAINTALLNEFNAFIKTRMIDPISLEDLNPAFVNRLKFDYQKKSK
ncbi:hypothetical protein CKF54_07590 [Psittacicella hinzii]|uniref:HTH arsR-type domain-containing protein n=1 Tax=Psittacicella hinzii TaxID=2028575 RepID=A0A3A1XYR5_9GAMM|nr:metalloregulator ArsR/SmtB family transcription factor [Psittacicella hinzii]RIY31113.1 hypothetical protein CKF54_07590 [Psittacicella hinzii]